MSLPQWLPLSYDHALVDSCTFRSNLTTEEDITKWVQEYSEKSNTCWNVKKRREDNRCVVFRKVYVCHRSGFNRVRPDANKKGRSKNIFCGAELEVVIKHVTRNTKKKDKFVKMGFPAIIKLRGEHNHVQEAAEELSTLRPSQSTREIFQSYFDAGLSIIKAINQHESKLQQEAGINSTILANAAVNPKYRTVQYWYKQWRNAHLGPKGGEGMLLEVDKESSGDEIPNISSNESLFTRTSEHKKQSLAREAPKFTVGDLVDCTVDAEPEALLKSKSIVVARTPSIIHVRNELCTKSLDVLRDVMNFSNIQHPATNITNTPEEEENELMEEVLHLMQLCHAEFETSAEVLREFKQRLERVHTPAMWEVFLNTAGRPSFVSLHHHPHPRIQVQPTTVTSCQSGNAGNNMKLPIGQPADQDQPSRKRKRHLT